MAVRVCKKCKGSGKIIVRDKAGQEQVQTCPACRGAGGIDTRTV